MEKIICLKLTIVLLVCTLIFGCQTGLTHTPSATASATTTAPSEYNVYLGDLHSHTGYSDGEGTPAQAYSQAKNSNRGDFLATTDHDEALYNDPGNWADTIAQANNYTDASFVAIAAFEGTYSPVGHWNTYNETTVPYMDLDIITYYNILTSQPDSISQYNHPGQPGEEDDFDDFAQWTPERDAVVTMLEIMNSKRHFEDRYISALDKGWHVSATGNSDTHSSNWLTGYEVRTGILMTSLTRENIYDAMRHRRTYATADRNLIISYTINGSVIGSILSSPASCNVSIHVEDPDTATNDDRITSIEIITNSGSVTANHSDNSHTVDWNTTIPTTANRYYYVRVTNSNGEKAYTAPIWIE